MKEAMRCHRILDFQVQIAALLSASGFQGDSKEMLVTFLILLSFITNSLSFEMFSHIRSSLKVKGIYSLLQKRNVRIMNPLHIPKTSVTAASTPALSATVLDEEDDLKDAFVAKNPKTVFLDVLLESLDKKEIQKLILSENRQINHDGSKIQNLKSVTARLIEIKAGLRLQLVYRYVTKDITKNLPLEEVESTVRDLLTSGFKKATLSSVKGTHELQLKRGNGSLKITAAPPSDPEAAPEGVPNLQHDRKKNIPVDPNAPFLRVCYDCDDSYFNDYDDSDDNSNGDGDSDDNIEGNSCADDSDGDSDDH